MAMKAPKAALIAIAALASAAAAAWILYSLWICAYNGLAASVNMRWDRSNPRAFVTPNDPAVQATASAAAYGNVNPVGEEELEMCIMMLYSWVSVNVRVRADSPYPMLPRQPGPPSFTSEVWQFPNETISLRAGDCEDAAVLLLSMVRFCAPRLYAACIVAEGSKSGHMAVLVADRSGRAAILDPALYYYSRDAAGRLKLKDFVGEVLKWLELVKPRVGEGARITLIFNERDLAAFKSTEQFVGYFASKVLGGG